MGRARSVAVVMMRTLLVVAAFAACQPPQHVQPEPVAAVPRVDPTPEARQRAYLVLRVAERRLYLRKDGADAPLGSFPIAVGRPGHETPTGEFHVEEKIVRPEFQKVDPNDIKRLLEVIPPGPRNPLGERWIGIAHGEGWSLGIHGTPNPELLGKAVSGGCIRMRNADVIRIYDEVEVGTKVFVYP